MTRLTSLLVAVGLATAVLPAQITATYVPFGSGCPGTGTGLGAGHVAPSAFANAFAPGGNAMCFTSQHARYQQVFTASQLPGVFTMGAVALRWDNQNMLQLPEALVDFEISVGYTTKTPTTLGTDFAANFDVAPPVNVLPRTLVTIPAQNNPPATNPTEFQVVFPWPVTFPWAPQPGQNLLVEFVQRGSSVPGWVYVFDCGHNSETARLYGSDTATTGSLDGFAYGYMMQFLEVTNTAVPVLANSDFPQIGGQFNVKLSQAKPSTFALLEHGVSNTTWNGGPLPVDLGMLGAPGCDLLTSADILLVRTVNAQGKASYSYTVPLSLSLQGVHIYNQYAVWDPTANAFGFAFSNGGDGVIGT